MLAQIIWDVYFDNYSYCMFGGDGVEFLSKALLSIHLAQLVDRMERIAEESHWKQAMRGRSSLMLPFSAASRLTRAVIFVRRRSSFG
jgi:hypothetical protein